ncbi:hypothetical protein BDN72DRAFT_827606 [Pluteus cervinus]|uniref:Uncharacterized protein n=1 Tax=Pluteus cervinus TaxID=181527 RepID=A0ACD3AAE5_9AGAR|nr:hypothetical protein BDN72DRAFT_827606 [Pluteus cervinus]
MNSAIKLPIPGEDTRRPFSFSLLALSQLIFIFALTQKRSWVTHLLFGAMASIMCYLALYTTTGNITIDNPVGSTIFTFLFMASDYLLVSNAPKNFRLRGQKEGIEEASFWERLKWALKLFSSPRGIGWTHEPVALIRRPNPPIRSKLKWLCQQLFWIAWWVLLMDVGGVSFSIPLPFVTASHSGSIWRYWAVKRAIGTLSYALPAVATIGNIYRVLAITTVVLGLCGTDEWPELFGWWGNAWSVRSFWGHTWHQMLRHLLLSHSKFFAHKILKLKRGTATTRYVYLYTAFILSGFSHQSGERMMLGHWGGTTIYFYLGQALAISFEEGVVWCAAKLKISANPSSSWIWRVVGYFWVWIWFSVSLDPVMSGLMIRHSEHFSLVMGMWKGDWTPRVV